jgi:CelD/BcsL family acetyltransferase involved in cellulose biosynthesis
MELKLYQEFPGDLQSEWNELLAQSSVHVPFLRYEYLETWWQTRGGGEWSQDARLALITARDGERLIGIAPLFLATWEGIPTLLLLGSIEISDYLDLIAASADLPRFTSALLPFLAQEPALAGWQRLDFYNVLESSPALAALRSAAQEQGWNCALEPFRPALTIPLPGDWETYLAEIDKKQRHEIRRKMRRAYESEHAVRWYYVQDPATLESEIDAFLNLMSQDEEKARFLTPPMRQNFRATMSCAFAVGCLHLSFLEIDGSKAASYLSMDYLNQLWVYNSGIDARFIEFSPGWVLLGELLRWANENKRSAFDFMRGDEDYKIRFGAQKRDVMRITINQA